MTRVTRLGDVPPTQPFTGKRRSWLLKGCAIFRESQAYWLRAVGLWALLMAAETLQGLWRVKVLAVWIGDEFARDVGVFTGSLVALTKTCDALCRIEKNPVLWLDRGFSPSFNILCED